MPSILKYVAQNCMDSWYQQFKNDSQFFTLEDFIDNTGNTIAGFYQKYYEQQYKDLRAEKKDEIVTFDTGMLSEQVLDIVQKDGVYYAEIKQPIMTFMYDQNNTGVQIVLDAFTNNEIERTTINEKWQLNYLPKTNRIFYYVDTVRINFINKGDCNIKKVKVLYVPQMHPDAVIADTLADDAVQQTVLQMRQLADRTVVKKTLDNNDNLVLEAEFNKQQVIK